MFQPFIWMFKTKNFKKHVLFLIILCIMTNILALTANLLLNSIGIAFIVIQLLFLLGYFWNLTSQVIDRAGDISANSIYNGRIKENFVIELPSLQIVKNIWRGIASIVASVLLMLPCAYIIINSFSSELIESLPPITVILIYIIFWSVLPALFWNYAKNNSVFSVLNLRKAIFVMGNYTLKYFYNIFVLIVINFVSAFIDNIVYSGITNIIPLENLMLFNVVDIPQALILFILMLIIDIKAIYMIYVNSYLIGTVSPVGEC